MGQLVSIKLPLGLVWNGTEQDSQGRYRSSDLIRDADDTIRPVSGWRSKTTGLVGKARSIFLWKDDAGVAYGAVGTHRRLYAIDRAGVAYDITPVRKTSTPTDPFSVTSGSALVTVTDAAHGAVTGDEVTFSGGTVVGGLTLNDTYQVEVVDADTYTITALALASATESGGGLVTAVYKISPGNADSDLTGGYGNHLYGWGAYGTPRPDTEMPTDIRVWSLKTWGEHLLACPNGQIYEWQLSTGAPATLVANAPQARAVHVTANRIPMALGADGNPRLTKWGDREDNTDWTPSAANYAGDFELQSAGRLMCGASIPGGELLLTDTDAWLARFVGFPLVYGFEQIGVGCGIVSQGALVTISGDATPANAVWMASRSFMQCKGNYVAPLACDVADYVFSDINRTQIQKVTAFHNTEWGEVWWWYPSASSTEIDRYVLWSYRTGRWFFGSVARLCATEKGPLLYPLAVDEDGTIYEHEVGYDYDGIEPWIESGPFQIAEGETVFSVLKIIPDERTLGDVQVTFYVKNQPNSSVEAVHGPYSLTEARSVRFKGRYMRVRFTGARLADWRVGGFKLDIRAGERR